MSFFVDANVIAYAAVSGPQKDTCAWLLQGIAEGADGHTSTAVVEEVWHLELIGRLGPASGIAETAHTVFTPLLAVTDAIVSRALALDVRGLGANDRIHVATCLENGIDTIVTADADFDGVRGIRRVDPLDRRAVTRLLNR